MEQCCTNTKCKCYIKCNESPEIFVGGRGYVLHNQDADREACLNRQILNNSVKRKAMEDLCERPHKLIHRELRSQQLITLTYKFIRNISRNMHKARFSQLLPFATDNWRNSWSIKCCTSVNKFDRSCLLMTRKKTIVMFSCKNNLQFFFAPLMGITLTGHSNQHRSFSTNYLQFIDSLCSTWIFLTGQ